MQPGNLNQAEARNDRVAFLHLHRAKKRRAQAAAKADARRGRLITAFLLVVAILAGYTMQREQELLDLERVHHLP